MAGKKKVLVVCASEWNRRGLEGVSPLCDVVLHTYDYDFHRDTPDNSSLNPAALHNEIIGAVQRERVNGIVVTKDYPGALFASVAAQACGLRAPSVDAVLACQHKYWSRQLQQQCVPEAMPRFTLAHPGQQDIDLQGMQFPLFAKPVRANFSFLAQKVHTREELQQFVQQVRAAMPETFFAHMRWVIDGYRAHACDDGCCCRGCQCAGVLVEEWLDGVQVTLEVVVVDGRVQLIGLVDSIMFPGTISFSRFVYPSELPASVQARMLDITKRFVTGIRFDNGLLNVEFMYNPATDAIHIIEVNPRMVQQFADMMEKVDGVNTYEHAVRVALGMPVTVRSGAGKDGVAVSFPLRIFEDKRVVRVPSPDDCARVIDRFSGAEIYVWVAPGDLLSEHQQDGQSFCYGRINLGARDMQEVQEKFAECMRLLPFTFIPA